MKPRNTLVTVVEVKDPAQKTDAGIIVPDATGKQYSICEVVEVGPGYAQFGERSATDDLASGQRVLVKTHQQSRGPGGGLDPIGIGFTDDKGRNLILVEEQQIVGIVGIVGGSPAPGTYSNDRPLKLN